jgi:hypothetical protein
VKPTEGGCRVGLNLSGLTVCLDGLSDSLAERLRREWSSFVDALSDYPFLHVEVAAAREDMAPGEKFVPKAMPSRLGSITARYRMPEGTAVVANSGRARIRLGRNLGQREYFTLQNLLRACLAWSLPSRGGALLHAAGLVVDGRAYLMVGPEGSGKSTWAALGERGGALVLSDDLTLIDGIGPRPEVLGAPFRSTHAAPFLRGRWPLAAVLFPQHGGDSGWSPAPALVAKARIAANLPFIAEGIQHDSRIPLLIDRLSGAVPCVEFTFGLDSSFVELLRSWPSVE